MRYICLLRGINVSGQRQIKMVELCELCSSLGFQNAENYLQSGNIILNSDLTSSQVDKKLSQAISDEFGYSDVDVIVLESQELLKIIRENPYQGEKYDTSKVYFTFLKTVPDSALRNEMNPKEFLPDEFSIASKEVYVYCPNGYGRTKINNSYFERKLKVRSTTRNYRTTQKLFQLSCV